MPELKPGWKMVKFGDVVRLSKARSTDPLADGIERYVGLEHIEPGDLRIRSWGNVSEGTTFTSRFRPGQVLFGKRRAYQRKVAVADFEGVCSGDIYVLESANPERLLSELLPFICQTDAFFEYAIGTSAGSLSPRTNWTSLAAYEFVLPPLATQSRVTKALGTLNTLIETYIDGMETLDVAEAALLFAEFGRFSPEVTRVFPHLSSVAVVHTGIAKGRSHEVGKTVELPYLRVANVKDGYLDLSDVQNIVVEAHRVRDYLLQLGDVLMTEGGDLDKLGRGTVWQGEIENCVHQNHVFSVRPDTDRLDPWYLAALARSTFGRGYFQKCAKRTSNLASINKREVETCPIPVRSIEHQRQFVDQWREFGRVRSELELRAINARGLQTVLLDTSLNDL